MRLPGVVADGFSAAEGKGLEAAETSHPGTVNYSAQRSDLPKITLSAWTRRPGLIGPKSIPYPFPLVVALPVKSGQQRERT